MVVSANKVGWVEYLLWKMPQNTAFQQPASEIYGAASSAMVRSRNANAVLIIIKDVCVWT